MKLVLVGFNGKSLVPKCRNKAAYSAMLIKHVHGQISFWHPNAPHFHRRRNGQGRKEVYRCPFAVHRLYPVKKPSQLLAKMREVFDAPHTPS